MKLSRFLCRFGIFAALLLLLAVARAQETAPIVGAVPSAASANSLSGTPLFWADGIVSTDDLPAYQSVGLNAVVVRLSWRPKPGGDLAALDLAPQRAFAEAAAKLGLKIIYALPAAPKDMEFALRIAGDSPSYNLLWTTWATSAIAALGDTPGLIGWMLPDDPRGLPIFDDAGLRAWIGRNYANIDVVNAQWGSHFQNLDDVTIADAEGLAARWKSSSVLAGPGALGPLGDVADQTINRNLAFHPAALALGAYNWDAYRSLLTLWIGAIRGADAGHLLFSGELPDYAQLLSMPAGVDVMVPSIAPGVAENDIVTHNPQSIDIARRGGKFAALPVFSLAATAALPAEALPDLSKRWIQEACARGAVGAGFDDWESLKNNLTLRQSLLEKLRELQSAPSLALWGESPVATTAVVLTPLADGATQGYGPLTIGARRGYYGWAQDLVDGEPSNLVWSLRWGTAFGGVDFLAPEDLNGPLEAYNTIFAPQMLSCSLENQTALTNYVTGGGVLVADLGLGALQNGGQVNGIPPAMALLFGVPGSYDVRPLAFNLNGVAPHELLPQWSNMMQMRRKVSLTRGDSLDGAAFSGPVGFSVLAPTAVTVAMGPQIGTRLNGGVEAILRAPLSIHSAGRGYAIWAPFRMWTSWRPGQGGFDGFHGDLMARGATLALARNAQGPVNDIVPAPANVPEGITRFPEIINRASDVTLVDHDAPGQPMQLAHIETAGVGDWLWSGGIVQLPNGLNTGLVGGRPAPIDNPEPIDNRLRPLNLFAALSPGEMTTLHMEPITIRNLSGGPLCAQVVAHSRAGADINVWPNSEAVLPAVEGDQWQPALGPPAKFRLAIYSSARGLQLKPGARVRAVFTSYNFNSSKKNSASTKELFAVVDAQGRASWEFEGSACRVQIAGVG